MIKVSDVPKTVASMAGEKNIENKLAADPS